MSIGSETVDAKCARGRLFLERGCDAYEAGEYAAAAQLFRQAARLGNPNAQLNLGNLYDAGEGVEVRYESAIRFYRLAAKKGLPEAAHNLAIAYRNRGNDRWAQFWFRRASDMGDVDAAAEMSRG